MKSCPFAGAAVVRNCVLAAQTYPNKPIRLVVPFAPGGSSSTIVARSVATEMEKGSASRSSSRTRAAAAATSAMQDVARADPDGYTLIIGHVGTLAVNPYMYDKPAATT